MSYKWIKVQTHVHTLNSDGADTLRDMAEAAKRESVDAIFLTDHNTMYGYSDVDKISKETNVTIIKAIEYTTFYGHIITVNAPYFRWETIKQDSLNKLAEHVHNHDGIIGIAHPMAVGNPVCTGGRYEFINTDFSKIDFIEEWHGVSNKYNEHEKNEKFCIDKINNGNIITYLYGGDFHKKEHFKESNEFNYVLINDEKDIKSEVINAIRKGRVVMSKGPRIDMNVERVNWVYGMGDIVELNKNDQINIKLDNYNMNKNYTMRLTLSYNNGKRNVVNLREKNIEIYGINDIKWMRAEIINKNSKEVLAKGNPIYLKYI